MRDMTAALIIEDGKILVVYNIKHDGLRVEPPGGKREGNENLETCVKREVKEELGIGIEPLKLFGVYETQSPEGPFKVYMYLSKIIEGVPRLTEPQNVSNFEWCSYKKLQEYKEQGVLVPNMCSALKELRKLM